MLHWVVVDPQELQLLKGGEPLNDGEVLDVVERQVQGL